MLEAYIGPGYKAVPLRWPNVLQAHVSRGWSRRKVEQMRSKQFINSTGDQLSTQKTSGPQKLGGKE